MNIFVNKLDENLRNFHVYHFLGIAAILEIFDFEICLLYLLEISLQSGIGIWDITLDNRCRDFVHYKQSPMNSVETYVYYFFV